MKVAIEEVLDIIARLDEINDVPLNQIEWTHGGDVLSISDDVIEEWKYMGLSNKDFVYFEIMNRLEEFDV